MTSPTKGFLPTLTAACLLLALAGCATPGFFKLSKAKSPKTGPKNPVIRILGMWEAADGIAHGKSTRGFSGQILFFGQNSDMPAQVDGDVRIYVFDDQGTPEQQVEAFHTFDFDAVTWNAFMFNGPLGATYAVFIPYSRPGIHEAKCALRIRYTPKGGFPSYSEMVNVVLPGTKTFKQEGQPQLTPIESDESATLSSTPDVTGKTAPRARGISTPLPTPQEIQEQLQAKRPHAIELDEHERRRIMSEASARLKNESGSRIQLAGHEETELEAVGLSKGRMEQGHSDNPPADEEDEFFDDLTGNEEGEAG
jgi:hypothetical protein